jgi:hypothetical protein
LKLKCDEPLSNVAFKFNLRRHALVNILGIFCFGILLARPDWALYLGFLAFGCFRAWQGRTLNTPFLIYTTSFDRAFARRPMRFKVSSFDLMESVTWRAASVRP